SQRCNSDTREMEVADVTTAQDSADATESDENLSPGDEQLIRELTQRARENGLQLTGRNGLLGKLTARIIEGALEGEMDDHLGYARHDAEGRNGRREKTVLTDSGPVGISVPRDRDSSFEPKIVGKRQRHLTGIDDMVISL